MAELMGDVKTEVLLEKISAGLKTINFRLTLPDYSEWMKLAPLDAKNPIGFYDITNALQEIAKKIGMGHMMLQPPHTTMRIIMNEKELGYLKDLATHLQRNFPAEGEDMHYNHNENHYPASCKNGHAHLMADKFPLIQGILIKNGALNIGNYLSVFAMDLYPLEEGKIRHVDVTISGVSVE